MLILSCLIPPHGWSFHLCIFLHHILKYRTHSRVPSVCLQLPTTHLPSVWTKHDQISTYHPPRKSFLFQITLCPKGSSSIGSKRTSTDSGLFFLLHPQHSSIKELDYFLIKCILISHPPYLYPMLLSTSLLYNVFPLQQHLLQFYFLNPLFFLTGL